MDTGGLRTVLNRVADAAERAARDPREVTVVVVAKGRGSSDIRALYDAGHRDFGENRPEDLAAKAEDLPDDIRWHLVGTVQRRKVATAVSHTHLLHSLDRESLARRWRSVEHPPPVLVQVNIAREPQKHGVDPEGVAALVDLSVGIGLDVRGLMVIPPQPDKPEDSRRWFEALADLRDRIAVSHPAVRELSMGMTDDFEVAVAAGASLIRVGRAIFDDGQQGAP